MKEAITWLLSQPDFLLTQNRLVIASKDCAYSDTTRPGETAEDLVNIAYEKLVAGPARRDTVVGYD